MRGARSLTDQEIKKMLQGFTGKYAPRNRLLFLLRLKTGLRVQEALAIKISDVTDQEGSVSSRLYLPRKYTKGKTGSRSIPLHPLLIKELQAFIPVSGLSSKEYLFMGRKGRPLSNKSVWRVEREVCKLLGIDARRVGTHSTRKTFAQKVHKIYGGDLLKTRLALGHKDINSTIQYLSVDDGEVDKGILGV